MGVGLNLDECVVCGNTNVVALSHSRGGYVCSKCRKNEMLISDKVLKMMRLYYYVDISKISKLDINNEVILSIDNFLDHYYKDYTGLFLKSKRFLDNLKKVTIQ